MADERHGSGEEYAVDERLIMPETRYEVVGGQVQYVSPADQPHASRHSKLQAVLEAYAAETHDVACDMLTRTSPKDDMAPDASIYASAPHPETGGRQLEELAFEVVSTETLAHAGKKAKELTRRGVRRVFGIDVSRKRGLEWSQATDTWEILAPDATVEDPALAVPLALYDLVAASKADDAVARALLAKSNRVLEEALRARHDEGRTAGKAEGKAEAVLSVLVARSIEIPSRVRAEVLTMRDPKALEALLTRAATCSSADELLE